jgi:hypothetical protein
LSGLLTWLDTEREFPSGEVALAFSKISSMLSGFAPGLFQNFWKIRPDWYQASPTIARDPLISYRSSHQLTWRWRGPFSQKHAEHSNSKKSGSVSSARGTQMPMSDEIIHKFDRSPSKELNVGIKLLETTASSHIFQANGEFKAKLPKLQGAFFFFFFFANKSRKAQGIPAHCIQAVIAQTHQITGVRHLGGRFGG